MEVLSHGSRAQGTSLVDHEALKRERHSDERALCYASIDSDNQNVTLGVLGKPAAAREM